MYAAKAIYAMLMAAIIAAQAIYTDITWLTIVLAALTPLGVYLVPNTPDVATPPEAPVFGGGGLGGS